MAENQRKQMVSIVTPMYNESDNVGTFFEKINALKSPNTDFEIIVVNDGSRDDTLEKLQGKLKTQKNLKIVNLSRNFGQEPAVFAGVDNATGDAIIVMDADMQDPPELITQMLDKWREGYDVVNAKRVNRKVDSFKQRATAKFYYRVLNKLSYKVKYPENVNNFRLISRRVADIIKKFPSNDKLFRNAVAQAGFKTADIEFTRAPRVAGKSKVNMKSMLRLSFQGISDSTEKPLHFAFKLAIAFMIIGGLGIAIAATFLGFGIFYSQDKYIRAWGAGKPLIDPSISFGIAIPFFLLFPMMFFTGIILLFQSINSFYLGKVHTEVKGRPMYIIEGIYKQ
ncbi:MAG: glycosyltransferase family 2 protein [Christensenellaceae bacterium]|jgi:glycosyltransferase involved in cell wall biosynthesis|nr:glycosyltransferase family 2 protein [Christensenellaceae bacterium]